jgi:hypothetical protein
LAAGDTLTIGGTVLTGIAASRTSGSDDFSTLGGTTDAIAAEITAAINDAGNSFTAVVTASVLGSVITLTAATAGVGGNAITLADSTTPAAGFTLSGATLTGGSSAGSLVASENLTIEDCELVASGVGSAQVNADTCNYINIRGGTFRGSSSTSLITAANCAAVRLFGVEWVNDVALSYDTGIAQPSDTSSEYELVECGRVLDSTVSLVGAGSYTMASCPRVGDVTIGGDRSLDIRDSVIGALSLADTTAATLRTTERGAASVAAGTPTLAESKEVGSVVHPSAPVVVPFSVPQPDTSYEVTISPDVFSAIFAVTAKTAASFTISASAAVASTVGFVVHRNL